MLIRKFKSIRIVEILKIPKPT